MLVTSLLSVPLATEIGMPQPHYPDGLFGTGRPLVFKECTHGQ